MLDWQKVSIGLGSCLPLNWQQAITWNSIVLVYRTIDASLDLDALTELFCLQLFNRVFAVEGMKLE